MIFLRTEWYTTISGRNLHCLQSTAEDTCTEQPQRWHGSDRPRRPPSATLRALWLPPCLQICWWLSIPVQYPDSYRDWDTYFCEKGTFSNSYKGCHPPRALWAGTPVPHYNSRWHPQLSLHTHPKITPRKKHFPSPCTETEICARYA